MAPAWRELVVGAGVVVEGSRGLHYGGWRGRSELLGD